MRVRFTMLLQVAFPLGGVTTSEAGEWLIDILVQFQVSGQLLVTGSFERTEVARRRIRRRLSAQIVHHHVLLKVVHARRCVHTLLTRVRVVTAAVVISVARRSGFVARVTVGISGSNDGDVRRSTGQLSFRVVLFRTDVVQVEGWTQKLRLVDDVLDPSKF